MHFGLLPYCRKIALLFGDSYKVGLVALTICAAVSIWQKQESPFLLLSYKCKRADHALFLKATVCE